MLLTKLVSLKIRDIDRNTVRNTISEKRNVTKVFLYLKLI